MSNPAKRALYVAFALFAAPAAGRALPPADYAAAATLPLTTSFREFWGSLMMGMHLDLPHRTGHAASAHHGHPPLPAGVAAHHNGKAPHEQHRPGSGAGKHAAVDNLGATPIEAWGGVGDAAVFGSDTGPLLQPVVDPLFASNAPYGLDNEAGRVVAMADVAQTTQRIPVSHGDDRYYPQHDEVNSGHGPVKTIVGAGTGLIDQAYQWYMNVDSTKAYAGSTTSAAVHGIDVADDLDALRGTGSGARSRPLDMDFLADSTHVWQSSASGALSGGGLGECLFWAFCAVLVCALIRTVYALVLSLLGIEDCDDFDEEEQRWASAHPTRYETWHSRRPRRGYHGCKLPPYCPPIEPIDVKSV